MYDFVVIGGGILGLSTAWQLQQRYPKKKIVLLEKEQNLASHQTGHNSGVIHAGVYYTPGSLKARFCREGLRQTIGFCREHGIPIQQPGKLIVATDQLEYQRMLLLKGRCAENELAVELWDAGALRERELSIAGVGALYVADTGIVDYRQVSQAMAKQFQQLGGEIQLNTPVETLQETSDAVTVESTLQTYRGKFLIACAGLYADRIATLMGLGSGFQIVPFRGEYYQLPAGKQGLVKHLIYPVPDPVLPFLGVHLSPMIDGSITVGPNALLGWKREGYGRVNISVKDSRQMLGFPGFWKVAAKHWRAGISEVKNASFKSGYLKRVQKYCPELTIHDLQPYPAGVRAQAVLKDGSLVDDFLFRESKRSLHVCNAPSPAATSAIPIGRYICEQVVERGVL